MKKYIFFKHSVIQLLFILCSIFSEKVVVIINSVMKFLGINPTDSHLSFGLYVYLVLFILLSAFYVLMTEIKDKNNFSKNVNFWFVRIELVAVISLCMINFFT